MTTLHIRQEAAGKKHKIRLTLTRPSQPDIEGDATIAFALTLPEQEELRWYMEDYLQVAAVVEEVQVRQIEEWIRRRGEELYDKVLAANRDTQAIWFAVREHLADLRIEITTGIAEAGAVLCAGPVESEHRFRTRASSQGGASPAAVRGLPSGRHGRCCTTGGGEPAVAGPGR